MLLIRRMEQKIESLFSQGLLRGTTHCCIGEEAVPVALSELIDKEAEKRLETIKEFNELGSGFKIAMRDLSIRGSGDLLGEEQSGFVESVGIDMYLKILDEEINHKAIEDIKQPNLSITKPLVSRTISKDYIETDDMRIKIHKRINKIKGIDDAKKLILELEDRFGNVPEEVLLYIYEKTIDKYCEELSIYKIDRDNKNMLVFYFEKGKSQNMDGNLLFSSLPLDNRIRLGYNKDKEIYINLYGMLTHKLEGFISICEYFEKIKGAIK